MNLTQLSKETGEALNISPQLAKEVLQSAIDNIVAVCHAGGRVTIQNFGYFESVLVQGRKYKLPSGKECETEDRWLLKFYSADAADNEVNEPFEDMG